MDDRRAGKRVVRLWYWLTLEDPIGTPVAVVLGLVIGCAIAWRLFA